MPFYSYTSNIPLSGDNPSTSAGQFNTNFTSIASIVNNDLYGFSNNSGGLHQQVTFPLKVSQGSQTDPQSVVFTASGTASSFADLQFKNQNGTFPLSTLRVLGSFTTVGTNGAVSLNTAFNVTSVTSSGSGATYTIALPAGAITGTSVAVFINSSTSSDTLNWSYTTNQLTISYAGSTSRTVSFQIYQV